MYISILYKNKLLKSISIKYDINQISLSYNILNLRSISKKMKHENRDN